MFNKQDPVSVVGAASYFFASVMALILGINTFDLRIQYSEQSGPDVEIKLKEPSAHILIFTVGPMMYALGIKVPPEAIPVILSRLLGVKASTASKDEEP